MDLPELYGRLARFYDVIYRGHLEKRVPAVVDFVLRVFERDGGREVRDVLDVACGTGGFTLEFARRGFRVVGVDLSVEMVRIARRKARERGLDAEFIVGDMRRFSFGERFDAVTCFSRA